MNEKTPALECPLCNQKNQCSAAAGEPAQDCWCFSATISASKLEAIPERDRSKRCICPACANGELPADNDKGEHT